MSDPIVEKSWAKARAALINHDKALMGQGIVNAEKMPRLTAEALHDVVPKLRAQGMSNRAIAKVTGVSARTVDRVPAASNGAKDAPNGASTRALLSQSDQNDWRTPRKYLDAAHATMNSHGDLARASICWTF